MTSFTDDPSAVDAYGRPLVEVVDTDDGWRLTTRYQYVEIRGKLYRTGLASVSESPTDPDNEKVAVDSWSRAAAVDRIEESLTGHEAFLRSVEQHADSDLVSKIPGASAEQVFVDRERVKLAFELTSKIREARRELKALSSESPRALHIAERAIADALSLGWESEVISRDLHALDAVRGRRQKEAGRAERKATPKARDRIVKKYRALLDTPKPSGKKRSKIETAREIVDTDDECRVGPRQVLRWAGEA